MWQGRGMISVEVENERAHGLFGEVTAYGSYRRYMVRGGGGGGFCGR